MNNISVKDTSIKTPTPYVKHNSSWKIPSEVWEKNNGIWKKSFQRPILWNKLESQSGGVVTSEIGVNGVLYGSPTFVSGVKFGNAVYAQTNIVPSGVDFTFTNQKTITVEAWCQATLNSGIRSLIASQYRDAINPSINIYWGGNISQFTFDFYPAGESTSYLRYRGSPATLGLTMGVVNTFHLAISVDFTNGIAKANRVKVYVNNVLVSWSINSDTSTDTHWNNSAGLGQIACAHWQAVAFNGQGKIDNVKVWNYLKTDFSDRNREGI